MKILIVAERYWPEVGAAPSRLANMAEGLKENGCDVEVLTGLPNYPKGKIFEIMKELDKVTVTSPVKVGDVIVEKVCGTEANIIATKNM